MQQETTGEKKCLKHVALAATWRTDHGGRECQTLCVNRKLARGNGHLLMNGNPGRVGEPTHGETRGAAGSRQAQLETGVSDATRTLALSLLTLLLLYTFYILLIHLDL